MTEQIIVLGWDALDRELIHEHDLDGQFGQHSKPIETFANQQTGKPHTKELWPSMISGVPPEQHGIKVHVENEGVTWDSTLLNRLSDIANGRVPKPILNWIGAYLRENGHKLEQKHTEYYQREGVETVFDAVRGRPISIPNYATAYDHRYNLDAQRETVWSSILADRDGRNGFDPVISIEGIYDVLGSELGKRLGHTITAMQQGYPLVWCWFGVLDTVGHIAPAVDAPLEQDWYQTCAGITETVAQLSGDKTTVVSLSDHGLQDGDHTEYATIASNNPEPVEQIDSVFDVAEWITETARGTVDSHSVDSDGMEQVKGQLRNLGYIQ